MLEQALERLKGLTAAEQDAMAALILEELADEAHWDSQFAGSQDQLARLAERARQEIRAGKVRDVGIDEL